MGKTFHFEDEEIGPPESGQAGQAAAPETGESFETALPVNTPPPRAALSPDERRQERRAAKTKDLPNSPEAEESILAACMADDGCLARTTESGLTTASFYTTENRAIFGAMVKRGAGGIEVLFEDLRQQVSLQRLMEISNRGLGGMVNLSALLQVVKEKEVRRDLIRGAASLQEQAYNGVELTDLQAQAESLSAAANGRKAIETAKTLETHRVTVAKAPKEPGTRLYLANKPIATPGNITTLISKAKTGKTAALGAVTASIITAAAGTTLLARDTFKFSAANPNGHAVIVIDTEQSPYDAFLCYQRSLKRAGDEADPAWLMHYSLVGYGPAQLHKALDVALAEGMARFKGIFLIILDGSADFVNSVNDEAEAKGFVTWLRQRTVQFECPAICVIHSNEGDKAGDDGRGHLGKELIRKAESNLLLKKSGEVTTITSDKQRKAPITEADKVAFRWDDLQGMHVTAGDAPDASDGGRPSKYILDDFKEIIPAAGTKPATPSQIHRFASQISDIKLNTLRDLLGRAVTKGHLVRTHDPKIGFAYAWAV